MGVSGRRVKALLAVAVGLAVVGYGCVTAQAATKAGIKVSPLANRAEASPLKGLSLDDQAYIFVANVNASSVSFFVDGSATPYSTDTSAPFDFNGTDAKGLAVGFDSRRWSNGPHSLTAIAVTPTGGRTFKSVFTVLNRGAGTVAIPAPTTTVKPISTTTTVRPTTTTTVVKATTTTTVVTPTGGSSSSSSCDIPFAQKYPGAQTMPALPTIPAEFPNQSSVGLNGVGINKCSLPQYRGPCTITASNTVIDHQHVTCDLVVEAANVVIKNTWVDKASISLGLYSGPNSSWSMNIQDSLVDAGYQQVPAVSDDNLTILRSEIKGGETAVHCSEVSLVCNIQDSLLHGEMIGARDPWHLGGFHTNAGSNFTLIHNSIFCETPANLVGEGCSGDVVMNSTWGPTSHALVQNNYMGASTGLAFCTYTGDQQSSYVVYQDNVFARGANGKCGDYGAVSDWNPGGVGNKWVNNKWDDGTTLNSNS